MATLAHATINEASKVVLAKRAADSNIGSADTTSPSLSTFLDTLVPVGVLAIVYFILFLALRNRFPRQYRPRTFLGSLRSSQRSPDVSKGFASWFGDFFNIPDTYVLNHHSLDGFLLLRLLKMSVVCCLVGCCITFPVLFPINATGGNGETQMNILTIGNVANKWKYFAHAGCAWLFFGFIIFMITRESIYYINLRQAYLLSPYYASRLSSRTVLFTSVPSEYLEEANIRKMFGESVVRVWFPSDTSDLDDLVKQRDKAAYKLEGAETKLIRTANGKRLKEDKKSGRKGSAETGMTNDVETGSIAARYLSEKDRPTHRLTMLIGKKVDTINWCRAELEKLIPQIDEHQAKHKAHDSKKLGSVFVEFATLAEAQAAYQSLAHHQVLHMAPRYAGMTPGEVIWSNLKIKWWERVVRGIVCTSIVVALIIFWSIPVAFVGSISNIKSLTKTLPFLSFINNCPSVLLGLIQGLLPSILLAVLMALLPIFLRLVAKLSGDPTLSQVELSVQNYYFGFQVVQVFLVATLGSAASASVGKIINDPSSAPSLLAQSIPNASSFYYSYFVLQGLGVVGSMLLSISGLVVFLLLGKFLDKTPRKMYKRWMNLSGLGWGTVFPIYTNLFVIAICYSCIAPLVLIFAAIGLWLFYFAYRYDLLFKSNANIDTKGRVYPRALQQIFVGLYVAEGCLIGLFAIATASSIGALGPLILMIILLIFTALYQMSLNTALGPLINFLPKSLESEERRLLEEDKVLSEKGMGNDTTELGPAPHKKPGMLTKFLKPHIYEDYATMRRLVPTNIEVRLEPTVEANAYFNPSITSETPLLWIPRDSMGISRQEVAETSKVIPITDEGAELDSKNKIVWDAEGGRPPIWQPTQYY